MKIDNIVQLPESLHTQSIRSHMSIMAERAKDQAIPPPFQKIEEYRDAKVREALANPTETMEKIQKSTGPYGLLNTTV